MSFEITQRDIDRVNARRARLQPLSDALGLKYNDSDSGLIECLDYLQKMQETDKKFAAAEALRGQKQQPANTNGRAAAGAPPRPANLTVLDQTVEIMAASRAHREPAAWATTPLNAGGK